VSEHPSKRSRDLLIVDHEASHLQLECFHKTIDTMYSYTRTYATIRETVLEEMETQQPDRLNVPAHQIRTQATMMPRLAELTLSS
jgi:hypothetical protein